MRLLKGLSLAVALTAPISSFAYTGNELQDWARSFELSQQNRTLDWKSSMLVGYVAGVAETVRGILICPTTKATHLQGAAIVSKFIRANPERWSEQASDLVVAALLTAYPACKT
ncbi:Rap1a/Tai family immunity protein [Pseudomonas sp. PS01300]|uniref:Rap1a/Tai family immunity protein n=1 Tax=Pseudomonas sp. PS01300 TaxID=2991436 RepID=UPI00249CB515|nr:Rap1a/Tai family immunity protein [Pseudomonas sp. PS01300]